MNTQTESEPGRAEEAQNSAHPFSWRQRVLHMLKQRAFRKRTGASCIHPKGLRASPLIRAVSQCFGEAWMLPIDGNCENRRRMKGGAGDVNRQVGDEGMDSSCRPTGPCSARRLTWCQRFASRVAHVRSPCLSLPPTNEI